jgi:hypothetical protein
MRMSNPQQPELARSRKTPAQDQDAVAGVVEGQRQPGAEGPTGPVPADNQPGHHPPKEQDKPDLESFAERMGITDEPRDQTAPAVSEDRTPPPVRPAPSPPLTAQARRAVPRVATALLFLVAGLFLTKRRRARKHRRG